MEGEGQLGLYNELEASLGHKTRPANFFFKEKEKKKKEKTGKKGDLSEHLQEPRIHLTSINSKVLCPPPLKIETASYVAQAGFEPLILALLLEYCALGICHHTQFYVVLVAESPRIVHFGQVLHPMAEPHP